MKTAVLFLSLLFTLSFEATAGVVFHDDVAVTGRPVMLKAETKGKFFRTGGEVVEFHVNGDSIGTVLSGGDGLAYKEFSFRKTGLYEITATSGKGKNTGYVLSLKRGTGIVFIDVTAGLFKSPFSKAPKQGSREAVEKIMEKFPVVYLHSMVFGMSFLKQWLDSNGFPPAPLLEWDSGEVFGETDKKGLGIKAVIGSPVVIESAKDYKPRAFSFEETEGADEVSDWKEIPEALLY